MNEAKILTRELITEHRDIGSYLPVGRIVRDTIEGRVCRETTLPFLALIADLMRERFPVRFGYLEIGTLFGASLCAVSFHQRKSEIEKYAGIDIFTYYGEEIDPTTGVKVSIERADRNLRYFGVQSFALFEGHSTNEATLKRALAYHRGGVSMLYLDGDHTAEGVEKDFELYAAHVVPGGVIIFDDYHSNDWPGVTEAVDRLEKTGWHDVGALSPTDSTLYVMQKEEADTDV